MSDPFTTTYWGHRIDIERYEWGYLASFIDPASGTALVTGGCSPLKALEEAFDAIDRACGRKPPAARGAMVVAQGHSGQPRSADPDPPARTR